VPIRHRWPDVRPSGAGPALGEWGLNDQRRKPGSLTINTVEVNRPSRYERTAVILHWFVALLIFALFATGWQMVGISTNTPERAFFFNLHKSLGILTALAIVALVVWRVMHSAPALPGSMPKWERAAAVVSHLLAYVLMFVATFTGYLTSSFSRYGPKLFGIPLPHWGWDDAALRGSFAAMHRFTALVLAVLIAIHIAAALKHLIVDKDGIFQRMLLR
jgi:cytochrome b561